jgi:hypothetical protein
MIRRHPGPNQTERGAQPLKQVHLHPADTHQLAGRIAGRRARADDRHPQRARLHRYVITAGGPNIHLQRMPLEVGGVDIAEPFQFRWLILVVVDRSDRALFQARATVDAGHRIDIQHLGAGELARSARGPDTVHRTHRDA